MLAPVIAYSENPPPSLMFMESASVYHSKAGLTEPSGLTARLEGGYWVVSDDTSSVFAIDKQGHLIERIDVDPSVPDLEGVAGISATQHLVLLSEKDAAIVEFNAESGRVTASHPILAMKGGDSIDFGKDGPEGIAIDEKGLVWVLVERPPQLLQVSHGFDEIARIIDLDSLPGFTGRKPLQKVDASGLAYDRSRKALWILSDEGKAVFYIQADAKRAVRFDLIYGKKDRKVRRVDNPEGIAISHDGSVLSIVTDDGKSSRLYRYEIQ